jgi:predicted nicotinamide N-methyase
VTDTVEEHIALRSGDVTLLRPRSAEDLLSEDAFEHEEFLPYWAELWSSAVALADDISPRSLGGRRVLELGCGLGLPSIAAAKAGARVLATDWSADAIRMAAANAERNGAEVETLVCSWTEPGPLVERAPWDLVIASDVLYERRNAAQLLELLPRLVDEAGEIWIADPGRVAAGRFVEQAGERFVLRTIASGRSGRVSIHRLRLR